MAKAQRKPKAAGSAASQPKPPVLLKIPKADCEDPLDFLMAVVRDGKAPGELRVRAAISCVQYTHTRTKDGGKNITKTQKAKDAASGKFAPGAPPKLSVVGSESAS